MPRSSYEDITYSPQVISGDILSSQDRYIKESTKNKDWINATFEEAWTPFAIQRMWQRRSSQFEADENWQVDQNEMNRLRSLYREEDVEYISKSKSKTEYTARHRFVDDDIKRMSMMAAGGWKGGAAFMAFSLFDPIGIPLSLATGGLGFMRTGTAAARIAKLALMSGLENVAIDSILMQGNTQSKASDLILSFGAGAAIGGGIGALTRGKNPKVGAEADEADAAVSIDADDYLVGNVANDISRNTKPVTLNRMDIVAVDKRIADHEKLLHSESKAGLAPKTVELLKKGITKLQSKYDSVFKDIKAAQAKLEVDRTKLSKMKVDAVKKAAPARAKIEVTFGKRISKQQDKIDGMYRRLDRKPGDKKILGKIYNEEVKLDNLKSELEQGMKSIDTRITRRVKRADNKLRLKIKALTEDLNRRKKLIEDQSSNDLDKIDKSKKAPTIKTELNEWRKLSKEEKVNRLYGDEDTPILSKVFNEQEASMRVDKGIDHDKIEVVEDTNLGSAGAASIDDPMLLPVHDMSDVERKGVHQLAFDGVNIPEKAKGLMFPFRSAFTDAVFAMSTVLSNSKNLAVRGWGWNFFDGAQGGPTNKTTVASRVKNETQMIEGARMNRVEEGQMMWAKENGISKHDAIMNPANVREFDSQVMIERQNPGTYPSPAIRHAAAGAGDQLQAGGKAMKEAGVTGFDNIDLDDNYIPAILDHGAIVRSVGTNGYGKTLDLLALGYQKGKFKLPKQVSYDVAEAVIARSKEHDLTIMGAIREVTDTDLQKISDDLRAAGVDDETIESFYEQSLKKELQPWISNRAKKSLRPNIGVSIGNLKFVNLINNDLPVILETYTREAAGSTAIAKQMGLFNEREVISSLRALKKHMQKSNMNPGEIEREMLIMEDGVNLAYGRSLNLEVRSKFVKNLSKFRDFTSMMRLQFNGIASAPELARITAKRELSTIKEAISSLGGIGGTKHFRKGGKYSGEFNRPDLAEQDQILRYMGEDHALFNRNIRADELEEAGSMVDTTGKIDDYSARISSYVDKALAQGRNIQEVLSGFRAIQGTGERISGRSIGIQLKKWVKGGKEFRQAEIEAAGWQDGYLDKLKEWMTDNPKTEMWEGREIDLFNFDKMPNKMQERLQIGMQRLMDREMLRIKMGESPRLMHKWFGQTLTQFRGFSIASMEKQLLHDIRHDRVMGSIMAMHSMAISYMALGVSSMYRHVGKEDAWEKIENDMTGTNALVGTLGRMGQLAGIGLIADPLATAGLLPQAALQGRDQQGARAMSPGSVPVVGMVSDLMQAPVAIANVLKGDEDSSRGDLLKKAIKESQDIIPFAKMIGANQAINVIQGSLD